MRAEVTRRVRFEAAHFLPGYSGACSRMHGHSWQAEIVCEGEVGSDGMLVDMGRIAQFFRSNLEPHLDHALLNDTIPLPTTEHVARYLLEAYTSAGFPVVRVTVRETENQTATVHA